MRKITQEACIAFRGGYAYRNGNTEVTVDGIDTSMYLHGNRIAYTIECALYVSLCGWNTPTTRERLNGIDGVHVTTKNGQAYLNGYKWNGDAVRVDTFEGNVSKSDTEKRNAMKKAIATYSKLYTFPYAMPDSSDCWYCNGTVPQREYTPHEHLHDHVEEGYAHGSLMRNALKEHGVDDLRMGIWFSFQHDENVQRIIRKYLQKRLVP